MQIKYRKSVMEGWKVWIQTNDGKEIPYAFGFSNSLSDATLQCLTRLKVGK